MATIWYRALATALGSLAEPLGRNKRTATKVKSSCSRAGNDSEGYQSDMGMTQKTVTKIHDSDGHESEGCDSDGHDSQNLDSDSHDSQDCDSKGHDSGDQNSDVLCPVTTTWHKGLTLGGLGSGGGAMLRPHPCSLNSIFLGDLNLRFKGRPS